MADTAHLRYRADIDGLRAIAVSAVVLFHAGVPFMPGGYVGVDVFFVISGYLITSILLKDTSWVGFYQRRARRILPALFAMLVVVLAVGAWTLLPSDFDKAAKSALATLAFVSNLFFWRQAGYFQPDVELMPLLHTWSLGVEEQFYIFFPWIVVACNKMKLRRRTVQILFVALAIGSFGLAEAGMMVRQATAVFYLLPTRAWELLVGSLLAAGLVPTIRAMWLRSLLAVVGLVALLWPILTYNNRTHFPASGALAPVLGSAMLLVAGGGGRHLLSRALEWRPVVFVGLISYSFYLWHWPVLVFARYRLVRELTPVEATLCVIVALLLAWASWRFVERPFRKGFSDRSIWLMSGGGLAAIGVVCGAIMLSGGIPARFSPAVVALNRDDGDTWKCPLSVTIPLGDTLACRLVGTGDADTADIILWGDSHAQMYAPALTRATGGRSAILLNAYSCAPTMQADHCNGRQVANYRLILNTSASTIIMAQNWPQYQAELGRRLGRDARPDEWFAPAIANLDATVHGLRAAGKKVILIAPIPRPGFQTASVLSRELAFYGKPQHPDATMRADYDRFFANVWAEMNALAAADPGVTILHAERAMCGPRLCPFIVDGGAVFADQGHLTTRYAPTLAPYFAAALKESATR